MKIVLVNLLAIFNKNKFVFLPNSYGLLSIAAVLREKKYKVKVIHPTASFINLKNDSEKEYKGIVKKIIKEKPSIVGFATRCDTYYHTICLARLLKKHMPNIKILFGGPHATATDVETMKAFSFVDFIIRGEAEQILAELIEALIRRKSMNEILGLTYRKSNKIIKNKKAGIIKNLNKLPIPAFDLLPKNSFKHKALYIEAGRGCPYKCSFCSTSSFFQYNYRLKSCNRIISEIKAIKKFTEEKTKINFIHDNFTANRNLCLRLCKKLLKSGLNIDWRCSTRIDCVDRELLYVMKQAGCESIFFGIETGSLKMQKIIGKNLNLKKTIQVIKDCKKLEIKTTASFIVGFPKETKKDVNDTLNLMSDLSYAGVRNVQLHLLSPLPGSSLYEKYFNKLAYDNYYLSDAANYMIKEDKKKIIIHNPKLFSTNYHFKSNLFSILDFSVFNTFGLAVNIFRETFYLIQKSSDNNSLLNLCLKISDMIKKENIKPETSSLVIHQQSMITVFKKALDRIIVLNYSDKSKIMKAYKKEKFFSSYTKL
jgi:radical SAM superfamily enzyme YgiQ (UPF0313 family)